MNNPAPKSTRILSIDVMRGLTLLLMLFVNDLYEAGVPAWLLHTKASVDGMGLADWVFPGFLFMVGMSIPYAIQSRRKNGESGIKIFSHVILRSASLLLIGVFMLNSGRLNPDLSGINKQLYAILMYVFIFLIWNKYPENSRFKKLFLGLKIAGIVGLGVLALIFKAGELQQLSWFVTSWWGILGLIGWGYLVAALSGLFVGNRLWPTVGLLVFFLGMNILSQLEMLNFLNFLKPVFGIIIGGNVPMIVLAGLVISLILKEGQISPEKKAGVILGLGVLSLALGFFLRNWFILSKIYATPSWGMVCNGISMIVFALLYLIVDIWEKQKWTVLFKTAGQNSLTTYLAPGFIYYTVWGLHIPFFFYKQDASQLLAVFGSLGWAFAMVGFSALLARMHVRLKL